MWQDLLTALALVFIIEGVMPFLYPQRWQRLVEFLAQVAPSSMRWAGFASMLVGVILLYVAR
ncbi:DUF2065 domain-containing protein [Halomonadaceae bacterium KBTZ08]